MRGVIFDRDNTLVDSNLHFLPNVIDSLQLLRDNGFQLAVATNQPDAAKGTGTVSNINSENSEIQYRLTMYGITLVSYMVCFHHPVGNKELGENYLIKSCDCRKPGSLMLENIINKHDWDKKHSWMVGDSEVDVRAGEKAGLNTALISDKGSLCAVMICRPSILEVSKRIVELTCL